MLRSVTTQKPSLLGSAPLLWEKVSDMVWVRLRACRLPSGPQADLARVHPFRTRRCPTPGVCACAQLGTARREPHALLRGSSSRLLNCTLWRRQHCCGVPATLGKRERVRFDRGGGLTGGSTIMSLILFHSRVKSTWVDCATSLRSYGAHSKIFHQ